MRHEDAFGRVTRHCIGIVGGTALTGLQGLESVRREFVETRYGAPSGPLMHGRLHGCDVVFLGRHGDRRDIPPHAVNYRANIRALADAGCRNVLAVAAVGSIAAHMPPGGLVIPDQIVDYTWGRAHSFWEAGGPMLHIDFTHPYDPGLRDAIVSAARAASLDVVDGGVYAATQGPRLETAAEIDRLERDGCDLVGMTGMPEAALAREAGLAYACAAIPVNWAAGRGEYGIHAEIDRHLSTGMQAVEALLAALLPRLVRAGDGV